MTMATRLPTTEWCWLRRNDGPTAGRRRVVHVVEGVWVAAVEQHVGRGLQSSTVSPQPSAFGRESNDPLTLRGRLPNDRPHIARLMGQRRRATHRVGLPPTVQHSAASPWAAAHRVTLPQDVDAPARAGRLPPAVVTTLLDVRLSRHSEWVSSDDRSAAGVLNLLNDARRRAWRQRR